MNIKRLNDQIKELKMLKSSFRTSMNRIRYYMEGGIEWTDGRDGPRELKMEQADIPRAKRTLETLKQQIAEIDAQVKELVG